MDRNDTLKTITKLEISEEKQHVESVFRTLPCDIYSLKQDNSANFKIWIINFLRVGIFEKSLTFCNWKVDLKFVVL